MIENIVIVDSHPIVRCGLKTMLTERRFNIVGEAANMDNLVHNLWSSRPELLIVDPVSQHENTLKNISRVKRSLNNFKILVYSVSESEYHITRSNELGIEGYVCKTWNVESLFQAIEKLNRGETYYPEQFISRQENTSADTTFLLSLTPREFQVLRLFSKGKTNKDIAIMLGLSNKTISTYKISIMKKLRVDNIMDVIDLAKRNDIN